MKDKSRAIIFKNLYDVSPVVRAAYPQTSVAMRKLEELRKESEEALQKAKEEAERKEQEEAEKKRKEELEKYYKEWEDKINALDKTED